MNWQLRYGLIQTNKYSLVLSIFDINKIMNEEHLRGYSSMSLLPEPKRKRTPSQYAAQIAELKNNHSTIPKKTKTLRFLDSERGNEENTKETANNALLCVLPSGKKYFLKIVGGSIKNRKIEKPLKNKQLKRQNSIGQAKEEKKKEASPSFFDKFLMVCQQLQKKSDHEPKEPAQNSKSPEHKSPLRRQDKTRKDKEKDDRWSKFHERFRALSERMDKLQANYIFLN